MHFLGSKGTPHAFQNSTSDLPRTCFLQMLKDLLVHDISGLHVSLIERDMTSAYFVLPALRRKDVSAYSGARIFGPQVFRKP